MRFATRSCSARRLAACATRAEEAGAAHRKAGGAHPLLHGDELHAEERAHAEANVADPVGVDVVARLEVVGQATQIDHRLAHEAQPCARLVEQGGDIERAGGALAVRRRIDGDAREVKPRPGVAQVRHARVVLAGVQPMLDDERRPVTAPVRATHKDTGHRLAGGPSEDEPFAAQTVPLINGERLRIEGRRTVIVEELHAFVIGHGHGRASFVGCAAHQRGSRRP
ncbi:MAG: hypothetical protein U0531_04010 [Dehalococcoidia bacterium]